MKITSIRQQIKNPERVSIFIDSKYAFSLSLDEIVKLKLSNSQELTQKDVERLTKLSQDGKLRARSLEWLLNRPHSTREFKDYLFRKKADPALTEKLIEEFMLKGYLDDVRFAEWLTDVLHRKHKSKRAIKAELMKKGVGRETIESVMVNETVDDETALKELIAKKQKQSRYKKDRTKLAKYLTSQGFSYEMVKDVLEFTKTDN